MENEENRQEKVVYDFTRKLLQPSLFERLKDYVRWQIKIRKGEESHHPDIGPVSINLDLTTGCNYECPHCVDLPILNQPIKFNHNELLSSLNLMYEKGLRSAILIGGGEPTLYSKFEDVVKFLKEREVHIGVVSNGTGMRKIENIGHLFTHHDWVRLSLDSGREETFQAMHKPRKPITLEKICKDVFSVKEKHPNVNVGFSYIVTWKGAYANLSLIHI